MVKGAIAAEEFLNEESALPSVHDLAFVPCHDLEALTGTLREAEALVVRRTKYCLTQVL